MIKKIIYILIGIALIFGLYKLLSIPPKNNSPSNIVVENSDLIFYWGDGCPHCENVEKWMAENNIDQKLKITKKEVYQDAENRKELIDSVNKYCPELNQNGVGVPIGFDPVNNKCIQGDTTIIDFLSQKIK